MSVTTTGVEGRLPGSILAVLTPDNEHNAAVMRTAIDKADGHPVVFLYVGEPGTTRLLRMFEFHDPYLDDQQAKETFGQAEHLARNAKVARRYLYKRREPGVVAHDWKMVHPRDTVLAAEYVPEVEDLNPDLIRYDLIPGGKVAHLLKQW